MPDPVPFGCVLPQLQVIPHMFVLIILCRILQRALLQLSRCTLCSSVLLTSATLVFPDSQILVFNTASQPGSIWVPLLCATVQKLHQSISKLEQP